MDPNLNKLLEELARLIDEYNRYLANTSNSPQIDIHSEISNILDKFSKHLRIIIQATNLKETTTKEKNDEQDT